MLCDLGQCLNAMRKVIGVSVVRAKLSSYCRRVSFVKSIRRNTNWYPIPKGIAFIDGTQRYPITFVLENVSHRAKRQRRLFEEKREKKRLHEISNDVICESANFTDSYPSNFSPSRSGRFPVVYHPCDNYVLLLFLSLSVLITG